MRSSEKIRAFKRTLHAGRGSPLEFHDGTKAIFHYQTLELKDGVDAASEDRADWNVIDDTRKTWPDGYGEPLELVFGKKFQLPIFETCLQSMLIDEICQFDIDMSELYAYPTVSKKLRDISKGKVTHTEHDHHDGHHCFAMTSQHGTGYATLDRLIAHPPRSLRFVFHLLNVLQPNEYEADSWQLSNEERYASVLQLKADGNALYGKGEWMAAIDKYRDALTRLDTLLLREKPGDVEWNALDQHNIALYLNLSQCYLNVGNYYEAIECADEALKRDANNTKALYRRAKGRVGVCDYELARVDLDRLAHMSTNGELTKLIERELTNIDRLCVQTETQSRAYCRAMFSR